MNQISVSSTPTPKGTRAVATTVRAISLDSLWAAITDYASYSAFMPRTVESRVESREGNEVVFATTLKFVLKKIRYRLRMLEERDEGRLSWTLIDGDIATSDGSWELEELGGGQLRITYTTVVSVGYRVPKRIEKTLVERSLPEVIENAVERARGFPARV